MYFAAIFIFITFVLIFPIHNNLFKSTKSPNVISPYDFDPELLITINCNRPDCERAKFAYNIWAKDFLDHYQNTEIKFVTTWNNVTDKDKTILVKDRNNTYLYRQIFYNDFKAFSYFLRNTNKKWMLRTTEDVFIHAQNFMKLLKNLTIERNETQPVLVGEVINPPFFVHGGPGWLMNRRGVLGWMNNQNYFRSYYEFHKDAGDDHLTPAYQKFEILSNEEMHTNLFYGFPIPKSTEQLLRNKDWENFRKCPPRRKIVNIVEKCRFKDVAIWHSGTPNNFAVEHAKELLSSAPDNLNMIIEYIEEDPQYITDLCYDGEDKEDNIINDNIIDDN